MMMQTILYHQLFNSTNDGKEQLNKKMERKNIYMSLTQKARNKVSVRVYKMLGDKKVTRDKFDRGLWNIHNVHKKVQAWQHKKQHKTRQDIYIVT